MKHMTKEIERIAWDHLMKIAHNEKHKVSLDVNGPGLVIVEQGPMTGWHIGIGIEHDADTPEDAPPSYSVIPIGGTRPGDDMIEKAVELVFSDALKHKQELSGKPVLAPVGAFEAIPNSTAQGAPERPKFAPRERASHFASKPGSESAIREAKADAKS